MDSLLLGFPSELCPTRECASLLLNRQHPDGLTVSGSTFPPSFLPLILSVVTGCHWCERVWTMIKLWLVQLRSVCVLHTSPARGTHCP